MTALDTTSAVSDNSVFRASGDESNIPANDAAIAQIPNPTFDTGETTTRRYLENKIRSQSGDLTCTLMEEAVE